jgi:hypothetical protein
MAEALGDADELPDLHDESVCVCAQPVHACACVSVRACLLVLHACARVRACVRACMRACVRVRMLVFCVHAVRVLVVCAHARVY